MRIDMLRPMAMARPPKLEVTSPRSDIAAPPAPGALDRWCAGVRAADSAADNVITVFDVIGEDFWTGGGVTASRVAGALRKIGNRDVEVHINSPGGDMFEGIAIYNLLREHPARVTVKVMGLAASAASIIAMAGDEVRIGLASFLMIHNCWVLAVGNRHDMRELADYLEPFDSAMADVYASRTGLPKDRIAAMMDAETFIGGSQAVEDGFADALLAADEIVEDEGATEQARAMNSVRRVEALLTHKGGLSRTAARSLISDLKGGKPGAAASATPGAGDTAWITGALSLIQTLRT